MSDRQQPTGRSHLSARERDFRSRLAKLIHGDGILRGSLSVRERTCGKPTCKCAKGEKHVSLYLTFSEDGKYRQLFVPKHLEEEVRAWVSNHQKARELLEEISRLHRDRIVNRDS